MPEPPRTTIDLSPFTSQLNPTLGDIARLPNHLLLNSAKGVCVYVGLVVLHYREHC